MGRLSALRSLGRDERSWTKDHSDDAKIARGTGNDGGHTGRSEWFNRSAAGLPRERYPANRSVQGGASGQVAGLMLVKLQILTSVQHEGYVPVLQVETQQPRPTRCGSGCREIDWGDNS